MNMLLKKYKNSRLPNCIVKLKRDLYRPKDFCIGCYFYLSNEECNIPHIIKDNICIQNYRYREVVNMYITLKIIREDVLKLVVHFLSISL